MLAALAKKMSEVCEISGGTMIGVEMPWPFRAKGETAQVVRQLAEDNGESDTKEPKLVGFRLVTVFAVDETDGHPVPEFHMADITATECIEGLGGSGLPRSILVAKDDRT